jgi:hypothetical protein
MVRQNQIITSGQEVKMARKNPGTEEEIEREEALHNLEKIDGPKISTCKPRSEDLGEYYIRRMQETMEAWFSKPRDGFHVSDVCLCPRQKVYREIDRVPIDAKTVSIYSAGKAVHEAVQLLFLNDKRTFEREKYIEFEDIQGSVDIYDRRRNIPLEFKTTRASDIKEPKSFHVDQLKYYMAILEAPEGYMLSETPHSNPSK